MITLKGTTEIVKRDFDNVNTHTYGYVKGRMFGSWIEANSRSNGYSVGDLIENPAYIIESLLRDEIFVERNLRPTANSLAVSGYVEISGLRNNVNDYYNGCDINLVDSTQNDVFVCTDYDAATNRLYGVSGYTMTANTNNIYLSNIKGDDKIDINSFDSIGNTTNGTRKDWKFTLSLTEQTNVKDIIREICETAFLLLIKSYGKYKLIAIEETSSTPDIWTAPAKQDGKEMLSLSPISMDFLYNDFVFNYKYHYGRDKTIANYFVNRKGYTSGLTNGSTLQGLCSDIYNDYGIERQLNSEYRYIRFNETAEYAFEKLVEWRTKLRLLVNWSGIFKDYNQYEIGDIVKLNHWLIPDSLRNTAQFMITGKEIVINMGNAHINFNLIQLG